MRDTHHALINNFLRSWEDIRIAQGLLSEELWESRLLRHQEKQSFVVEVIQRMPPSTWQGNTLSPFPFECPLVSDISMVGLADKHYRTIEKRIKRLCKYIRRGIHIEGIPAIFYNYWFLLVDPVLMEFDGEMYD